MVGFLAELELAGNQHTELVVIQPDDYPKRKKTAQSTWDGIDKQEIMDWIIERVKN